MTVPAFDLGPLAVGELVLPVAVFLGLVVAQAWESFDLGAY